MMEGCPALAFLGSSAALHLSSHSTTPHPSSQAKAKLGKAFRTRGLQACLLDLGQGPQQQNKRSRFVGSPLATRCAAVPPLAACLPLTTHSGHRAPEGTVQAPLLVLSAALAEALSASLLLLATGPAAHGLTSL